MQIVDKNSDISKVDFIKGATLLINKPYTWTSFDVVGKLRNLIRTKYQVKKIKVGHAGTLDPLATGLLLVCTGKHTKTIQSLQGLEKGYEASIKLGVITDSYDKEMPEKEPMDTSHLTNERVKEACLSFLGESKQVPPMFSAIKKNGTPLYRLAREGVTIPREPRDIIVHQMYVQNFVDPMIHLHLNVSKGTYIRTLADDIGRKLEVGGYLYNLKRTSIGEFNSDNAIEMESLVNSLEIATEKE